MDPRPRPEMKKQPDVIRSQDRVEVQKRADAIIARVNERYGPLYSKEMLDLGIGALQNYLIEFAPTPRSTGQEAPMGDRIIAWAEAREFHTERDVTGNVAYVVPGDPTLPVVGVHFHQDCVAVAHPNSPTHPAEHGVFPEIIDGRDRDLAPKEVFNDELWLRTEEDLTSGGLDNGLGGGFALMVSEHMSKLAQPHGTIVVLATVGEEVDFRGAKNIGFSEDGQVLPLLERADFIINDDMEADNDKPQAIEGAYGVEEFLITNPFAHQPLPENMQLISLSVDRLLAGHSGLYPERPHAGIVLLDQVSQILGNSGEKYQYQLASFEAGEKINAIGERGSIVLAVRKEVVAALLEELPQQQKVYPDESPVLTATVIEKREEVLTPEASQQAMNLLCSLAALHGPKNFQAADDQHLFSSYSRAFNLGAIKLTPEKGLHAEVSARIGQQTEYGVYGSLLESLSSEYPEMGVEMVTKIDMWPVDTTSILPKVVQEEYQRLPIEKTYPDLVVGIVPAGLELGTLHTRFPKSQNITLGMWIERIHRIGERANARGVLENAMLGTRVVERLSSGQDLESGSSSRRAVAA